MADQSIASTKLYLFPGRFGGPVVPATFRDPTDSSIHNVVTPAFQTGTRIMFKLAGTYTSAGWCELTYLKAGVEDTTLAVGVGSLCCPLLAATDQHTVTNDNSTGSMAVGMAAYALSAMTPGRYGFYWTGGYHPKELVSAFPTTLATVNTVTADKLVKCVALAAHVIGLGLDTLSGGAEDSAMAIGYSSVVDS